ncbi:MAG: hypothetical protein AB7G06_06205 [Bdellovibrionales bacterium]
MARKRTTHGRRTRPTATQIEVLRAMKYAVLLDELAQSFHTHLPGVSKRLHASVKEINRVWMREDRQVMEDHHARH